MYTDILRGRSVATEHILKAKKASNHCRRPVSVDKK